MVTFGTNYRHVRKDSTANPSKYCTTCRRRLPLPGDDLTMRVDGNLWFCQGCARTRCEFCERVLPLEASNLALRHKGELYYCQGHSEPWEPIADTLRALGPNLLGEPMTRSRRRARLERELSALWGSRPPIEVGTLPRSKTALSAWHKRLYRWLGCTDADGNLTTLR